MLRNGWTLAGYLLVVGAGLLGGCGALSSLTGNADTGLIPTSLTLDVGEFPEDPGDTGSARVVTTQPAAGSGKLNMIGATVVQGAHRMLDRGLSLIVKVNRDMANLNGTTLAGTFRVAARKITYKADFAAFDINGDGTAEGSGQPGVFPVAIRLWVDAAGDGNYQRLMCAVIDNKQTTRHFGSGQLYMHPGVIAPNVNPDYAVYATWDRTDPTHGWNEVFAAGTVHENYKLNSAHARVDVEALDGGILQKTLKATGTLLQNRFNITSFDFAARTNAGSGVALVNADAPGSSIDPISGACIALDADSPADGQCGAIDPTGMDFLAAPTGTETQWPAAFPETPTF